MQADFKVENPWKTTETVVKKPVEESKTSEAPSNLSAFLTVVADLLSYFESTQKSIERSSARISEKYPKFLSKLALFALQMDDSLFRETFMVQVLVFTQAI